MMLNCLIKGREIMRTSQIRLLLLVLASGFAINAYSNTAASGGHLFRKQSSDTSELNRYTRIALNFLENTKDVNYLKAYIDTAEQICVKKNIEFPASLHLARAHYFLLTNDFRNASQEASLAMKKSKGSGETDILARTLSFLGQYSLKTGFSLESISYFENSIATAEKNKIKGLIPGNYYWMNDVYDRLGNLKESRITLNKMIVAAAKENDTLHLEIGYCVLGRTYARDSINDLERDYQLSDSLFKKCLAISTARQDTQYIALPLALMGWNFYIEKKYDEAISFFNRTLNYSLPAGMYSYASNAYANLGNVYRDQGFPDKSIKYYLKSIEEAQKVNDVYNLQGVYKDMSDMYLKKRDTSNAFKSYVLYKKFNDALIVKYNTQGLADARIRYDVDAHNKEVELLSLRLYNQRLIIYGALGLFALSIAVLILLLGRARINNKRRISEMNRKIAEVTQANLRQQMNPHFIFNTLNSIQYYMYQHDKLATNNYLTKFASLMRKVLENSQHTSVPLRDELDALTLYLELEKIRFKDKFEYKITVDEEIDTLLYKVPTMLIQPYVENSICHGVIPGENKGYVMVDLRLKNEHILCTIEDDGIGREAALERKKPSDTNHCSLGTRIISSRLDLVNTLYGTDLKTTYTDLKDANGEPAGTRVEIQIPILS